MMELLLSSQYINHEIEIKANISKSLKYNEYIRFICLKFSKVFTFYHFPSISSYQPVVPKTTGISNTFEIQKRMSKLNGMILVILSPEMNKQLSSN